jgi:hypothetical protein
VISYPGRPVIIAGSIVEAKIAPMHCIMYIIASIEGIFPLRSIVMVIAGLIWHPDILPIAYTITRTDIPKASAIPRKPIFFPATTALFQ